MKYADKLGKIYDFFCGMTPGFPDQKSLEEIAGSNICEGSYILEGAENNTHQPAQETISMIDSQRQVFSRCVKTEMLKQINLNAILEEANSSVSGDEEVSDDYVEFGWLLNFMEMAGKISDKTLQKIWGRILSGKVKNTSAISLHSLFTISRISVREAELFKKTCRYVVAINGENLLLNDSSFNSKYGISYNDILRLDEYGLINSSGMLSLQLSWSNVARTHIRYGEYAAFGVSAEKKNTSLQIFTLREAGNDLLTIIDREVDKRYFDDFKECIKKDTAGLSFIDVNPG